MKKVLILLAILIVKSFCSTPPHTSGAINGLIYFPCDFNRASSSFRNFADALKTIWCEHSNLINNWDYIVGYPPGDPGNTTFDYFFDYCLNTGSDGYINIFTHGALTEEGWIGVEYYLTQNEALGRKNVLEQKYNAIGYIGIGQTPEGDWAVLISAGFFRNFITSPLPFSLFFIDACHSTEGYPSVAQSFIENGCECGFGWSQAIGGLRVQAPINIFYRMGGRNFSGDGLMPVIQNELRNKSADEAKMEYNDPDLVLLGNANMKMYNSPRIIKIEVKQFDKLLYQYKYIGGDYPGDLSVCPKEPAIINYQPLEFNIQFSISMNPSLIKVVIKSNQGNFTIPINGNWSKYIFENDTWIGVCDISKWCGNENAVVQVDAEDAFRDDKNDKLDIDGDGNSDGSDTNHKFKVALPPQVETTDPADVAENVYVYKNITTTFNKEMDPVTVNASTVRFSPMLQSGFTTSWSGDCKTVTLILPNPPPSLKFLTNYTITITEGVKDKDGTNLDGDQDGKPGGDYTFSFTTRKPDFSLTPESGILNFTKVGETQYQTFTITNNENCEIPLNSDIQLQGDGGAWTTTWLPYELIIAPNTSMDLMVDVTNSGQVPIACMAQIDVIWNSSGYKGRETVKKSAQLICQRRDQGNDGDNDGQSGGNGGGGGNGGNTPDGDHPDDNYIIQLPQYPTPWFIDGHAKIGILYQGFGSGFGHLLGRFKIPTCVVQSNLKILGFPDHSINDLDVLIIGSGGLRNLVNNQRFRQGLEDFVRLGGSLICMTQPSGMLFDMIPGQPQGYGWHEDQSCWTGSGYFSDWDVVLSGQDTTIIDAHIDGFFTQVPNNAQVIMKRRTTTMPELLQYDYGIGKVLITGLFSDWGYGQGQWSIDEVNLIRDIVTWAQDVQKPIAEYRTHDTVVLNVPVVYDTNFETLPANKATITVSSPNRDPLFSVNKTINPPILPGDSVTLILDGFNAPSGLGIYPVDYALFHDTIKVTPARLGTRFAVRTDIPVGEHYLGDFGIWATAPTDEIIKGSDVEYTIFIRNSTANNFSGKIMIGIHEEGGQWWEKVDSIVNVDIPADTFITVTYTRSLNKSTTTYFGLYSMTATNYQNFWTNAQACCEKGIRVIIIPVCSIAVATNFTNYIARDQLVYTINARASIKNNYTFEVRVLDKDDACIVLRSFMFNLNPHIIYSDSFFIDSTWLEGRYRLLVSAFINGNEVGKGWKYFNLQTSVMTVSLIPDTIITGKDTTFFVLGVRPPGTMINHSSLVFSLQTPRCTYLDSVKCDSIYEDTIPVVTDIPLELLYYGDYRWDYQLTADRSDTITGDYIQKNPFSLTPVLDKLTYLWGDTVVLNIQLKNEGYIARPLGIEFVTPCGSAFEWWIQDSLYARLGLDTVLQYKKVIHTGTYPGVYRIDCRLKYSEGAGSNYYPVFFQLNSPKLIMTTDNFSYNPGDTMAILVYNAGGIDAEFKMTRMALIDGFNRLVFEDTNQTIYSIPAEGSQSYKIPPDARMEGFYRVVMQGRIEAYNYDFNATETVRILGCKADVGLFTSKDVYLPWDSVIANANVVNSPCSLSGNLRLSISPYGLYPTEYAMIPDSLYWTPCEIEPPYTWGCNWSNGQLTLKGWDKLYRICYFGLENKDSRGGSFNLRQALKSMIDRRKSGSRGGEPIRYWALAATNTALYYSITTDGKRVIYGPWDLESGIWPLACSLSIASIYRFTLDDNNFYIADLDGGIVHKVSRTNGVLVKSWPIPTPLDIACRFGFIYIIDGVNHDVVKMTAEGDTVLVFGGDSLADPGALAIDNAGKIYVSDLQKEKVFIFDAAGPCVGAIGEGKFNLLHIDGSDYLYANQPDSMRMVKYDLAGQLIEYSSNHDALASLGDSLVSGSVVNDFILGEIYQNYGKTKGFTNTGYISIPALKFIRNFQTVDDSKSGSIEYFYKSYWQGGSQEIPIDSLEKTDFRGWDDNLSFGACLTSQGESPVIERIGFTAYSRKSEQTFWQDSLSLILNPGDTTVITRPAGVIPDSGEYLLSGNISLPNGQVLPWSQSHDFLIQPSALSLRMVLDHTVYWPGESAVITSVITNAADSALDQVNLELRKDTTIIFDTLLTSIGAQAACTLTVIRSDSASYLLTGIISNPGIGSLQQIKSVDIQTPDIYFLQCVYPCSVSHRPFETTTEIQNQWSRNLDIIVRHVCQNREYLDTITLSPDETRLIKHTFTLDSDDSLRVTLLPPAEQSESYPIRFGEKLATRIDSLTTEDKNPLIPYQIINTGEFPCTFECRYQVTDTFGFIHDSLTFISALGIGDTLTGEYHSNLDTGFYQLAWAVTPESCSTILSRGSVPIRIVLPDQVSVDSVMVMPICDSAGIITMIVPVKNSSARTFSGNIVLSSSFLHESRTLRMAPGTADTFRFTTDAELMPGCYPVTVYIEKGGNTIFSRSDSLAFIAHSLFDSLPEGLVFSSGDTARIAVRTKNQGTAVDMTTLKFDFGELGQETHLLRLNPGYNCTDTFTWFVPEDLAEKTYYASLWLGSQEQVVPVGIRGYNIQVQADLDRPNYQSGDTIAFRLRVENMNDRIVPGYGTISYNGGVERKDFFLSGSAQHIDFTIPDIIKNDGDTGIYISPVFWLNEWDSIRMATVGVPPYECWTRTVALDSVHCSAWLTDPLIINSNQAIAVQFNVQLPDTNSTLEQIRLTVYEAGTSWDTVLTTFEPPGIIKYFTAPFDPTARLLYYGVYTPTGRGLYISAIRIVPSNDTCNITCDRPHYTMGDTVTVEIQSPYSGRLHWQIDFTPVGLLRDSLDIDSLHHTFCFILPPELVSNVYTIDYQFDINGDTLHRFTSSYPFDVDGYQVSVFECRLDTNQYNPCDSMQMRLKLNSNYALPVIFNIRFSQNYHWFDGLCDTVNIDSGFNLVDLADKLPNLNRGEAYLTYYLNKDNMLLNYGSEGFMVYVSDSMPPVARLIQIPSNTYDPNHPYPVKLIATDETRIRDSLFYHDGTAWTVVTHQFIKGDTLIYNLPSQPRGINVALYAMLSDSFNNRTRLPETDFNQFWVLSPLPPTGSNIETINHKIRLTWDGPSEDMIYHNCYPRISTFDSTAIRFSPQYLPACITSVNLFVEKTIPDTAMIKIGFYSVNQGQPGAELYPPQEIKISSGGAGWIEAPISPISVNNELFLIFYGDGVKFYGDGNKNAYRTLINVGSWQADTTFGNLLAQATFTYEPDSMNYRVLRAESVLFEVIKDSLTDKIFTDSTVAGEKRYRYLVQSHYLTPDLYGMSSILTQVFDYTPPRFGDSIPILPEDSTYRIRVTITDGIGVKTDSISYNGMMASHDSINSSWYWYTIPKLTSTIAYFFTAKDSSGNTARKPDTGYYYIFPPISEGFSGHLTKDTTWISDIIIKGDVWIDSGVTLIVNPGVKVKFLPYTDYEHNGIDTTRSEFIVLGLLNAQGSDSLPVVFQSQGLSPHYGDWYGVRLESRDLDIRYKHLFIRDAEVGLSRNRTGFLKIDSCAFVGCNIGLQTISSLVQVIAASVTGNRRGLMINDGWLNAVQNCRLDSNSTALILNGSNVSKELFGIGPRILDFAENDLGGPVTDGSAQVALVINNTFTVNDTAIIFTNRSLGLVRQNRITENRIGVYITNNAWPILGIRTGQNLFIIRTDSLFPYTVYNNTSNYIFAEGNQWGTNDTAIIATHIWDYYDDHTKGIVDYIPFLPYNELLVGGAQGMEGVIEKFKIDFGPNPAPSISLRYNTKSHHKVIISIYDITGRLVDYEEKIQKSGDNHYQSKDLSNGVYFVRFYVPGIGAIKRKVIVLK